MAASWCFELRGGCWTGLVLARPIWHKKQMGVVFTLLFVEAQMSVGARPRIAAVELLRPVHYLILC